MKKNAMIVAGVMSGTSADGINVALVRIDGRAEKRSGFELIGHTERPYSKKIRATVLAAMNATRASVADLARLNFLLGELYSEAVLKAAQQFKVKLDLIGCHGQTLYHQGEAQPFLGRGIAATWQTGEGAVIAARIAVPVVSDFRPADLAAGGKGAPLVPFLDYALFRDPHIGRIAQNIGGIANLTLIPAGSTPSQIIACDTGPGNMVIDAVVEKLFNQPFDRNGRIAAKGKLQQEVIDDILLRDFFRRKPPKTAGREEFGREFVSEFLRKCKGRRKQDIVATATALTAQSIAETARPFASSRRASSRAYSEMILSGGGAKNSTLISMLRHDLAPMGIELLFSDHFGLPSAAKEAAAFAVLAYETWHRRPSNIPSATGAKGPAVLGKISYP
jgi:anhydro-N-acetylmuramic acid kinase